MSQNIFLVSDPHWGHKKMYELPFLRADGSPLRPWSSCEEADAVMVQRWNAAVKVNDKVYLLGDLAMSAAGLRTLERLNGIKVLCLGNHERENIKKYVQYFKDIRAYHILDGYLFSHVPVHPDSLRKALGNVHGHLHYQRVMTQWEEIDPRYFCVCVEHTDYAPIAWEEVKMRFRQQLDESGPRPL